MVKYETALDVFVTLFEYQNSEVIDLFVQYFTFFLRSLCSSRARGLFFSQQFKFPKPNRINFINTLLA